jgi:hypothetical protein
MQKSRHTLGIALAALITLAVLVRIVTVYSYAPAVFPDSGTYIRLAEQFLKLDFTGNNGWRTPGYPLLLAATRVDYDLVWIVQGLMGTAVTIMLFVLVFKATDSLAAAVVAGLAHTLALNQLLLEAAVLAEAMAGFLVTAAVYVASKAWERGWPPGLVALTAGLSAAAVLTRPVYIVLGAVVLMLIVIFGRENRARSALTFLVVFSAPLLLWMAFNKATLGYFGMSTLLGFNLTNHTGAFMEKAPDEYAAIRDVYLKYRDQRTAEGKSHSMTIFYARKELEEKTGLDDIQLSRELQRLSVGLILANPGAYLTGASKSWVGFFAVPTYWNTADARDPGAVRAISAISDAEKWALRVGSIVFLLVALPTLWIAWVRERGMSAPWNTASLMVAVVLAASVLQALLEYGENGRYGLPTQSLAMAAAITVVALAVGRRRRGSASVGHPSRRTAVGRAPSPVDSTTQN